jgi:tetratricopeptide (TPR) repeat protein
VVTLLNHVIRLCSFIKAYPGIKSFRFFQIRYKVTHYSDGGLDSNTLAEYYKGIFENQSELIHLNDFFERSDFLIPVLLLEDPPIDLVSTFQFAVDKYPEKILLQFTMARIYEMRNEPIRALDLYLKFIKHIESENTLDHPCDTGKYQDYSIEDYHIALSTITNLFYKHKKEYGLALEYADKCLREYQFYSEDIYSTTFLFIDPLQIRLRIHMFQDELMNFKKDYQLLRSKIDDADFAEMDDIDDIKEFARRLKM